MLQWQMLKFVPCRKCLSNGTPGYTRTETKIEKCPCLIRYESAIDDEITLSKTGIPRSYQASDLKKYKVKKDSKTFETLTQLDDKIITLDRSGAVIYLYGGPQTQKTTVLAHYIRKVAFSGSKAYYISMSQLVNALTKSSSFDVNSSTEANTSLLARMSSCGFLGIDDSFDLSKTYLNKENNFKSSMLNSFLGDFSANGGVILYASSIDPEKINSDLFGGSLKAGVLRSPFKIQMSDVITAEEMAANFFTKSL